MSNQDNDDNNNNNDHNNDNNDNNDSDDLEQQEVKLAESNSKSHEHEHDHDDDHNEHNTNTNTNTSTHNLSLDNSSICLDDALLFRHVSPRATSPTTTTTTTTTTRSRPTHHRTTSHTQELERIYQDAQINTRYTVHTSTVTRTLARQNSNASQTQEDQKKKKRWQWQTYLNKANVQRSIHNTLPLLSVLRTYSFGKLKSDIVAGVTVAILAIPLGMSYARLAGLPAHFGLYASFVPPLVYPIFGTTAQLGVGPAALISLIVSQAVGNIVTKDHPELVPEDEEYIRIYTGLAVQCSFLAGIFNIGLGVLRLGFVTQFLSRAVISGFVSGAAIIIALSQVQHILGISIPSSNKLHMIIKNLITYIGNFKWQTFILGISCIAFLLGAKKLSENETMQAKYKNIKWLRATSPIVVSILSIVLVYTLDLDQKNVRIIGYIPPGLPAITVADWTPIQSELLVIVVSMVIVGFVQSVAISKRIAYRRGYEIDPSQELVALGMASMIGGIFQSYPTSGAMGQSAVNDEIGTKLLYQ